MKKISLLITCYVGMMLTGCASIVSGSKQTISIETAAVKNAECSLENDKGKWFINQTPGSVVVHRSYKNLEVNCEKKGYKKSISSVKSRTIPLAFGNVIFGLGGAVGAGVDIANGAAYEYPTNIMVPMNAARAKA